MSLFSKNKKRNNRKNKILLFFLIFTIIFFGLSINFTKAASVDVGSLSESDCNLIEAVSGGTAIGVFDKGVCKKVGKTSWEGRIQSIKNWLLEKGLWNDKWLEESAAAIAFKKALANFLNTLAYDTATYLATGDEGQKPMFYTEGWGEYLKNVGDNAAGTFLETLGREGYIKFNLCEPNLAVKLKINLGLLRTERPKAPECTFSKMLDNWENELNNPNFLNNFQTMFNPWENDLGRALTLQTGIENEKTKELEAYLNERLEGLGFKSVKDHINDFIKTPGSIVRKFSEKPIDESTGKEKVFTGNLAADAIDVFVSTLAGKLLEKWLREGLVSDKEDNSYDWDKLSFESGGGNRGGIKGAKERFRKIIEPNFSVRGDYNILAELTQCADPTKAGPTNCVITDNFRQAIINKLTVGEAMEQGYLNPNGVFGFTADGLEPPYNEGYPYRSMIILRKFRIVPVGWEVAAQYIKERPEFISGTKNLKDLVACFDPVDGYAGYYASWCDGLVDPNWVLKAPLNYCKREGPGPEITNTQIIGTGEDSELSISRNDNYCGDEQSCIKEYDDGSCQLYGYCTEERRKWSFNSDSCEPKYNTCQTFRAGEGQTVSYLENTLDYGNCNAGNAGCNWYCEDYDYNDNNWTCGIDSGNKVYLNRNAEECGGEEEGCHEFIRTKPGIGANLLTNSSFEDNLADSIWNGDGIQSPESFSGSFGLELSADLNKNIAAGPADYSVAGQAYTLSFYAKDCGDQEFGIEGDLVQMETTSDWQYFSSTYIYPKSALGNTVDITITAAGSCIIDAIKLERGEGTQYSDYRGNGLVYQKLAPDYLDCDGAGDPAECGNFSRQCRADEVGCEMYTSVNSGMAIPAKVTAQDYCSAECVGYDIYVQKESVFDSLRDAYFIPDRAKSCSAKAAGCDEFTNLDVVEEGGEAREYYTSLRRCTPPGTACSEFYTWEGSEESGYQLRVYQYEVDGNDGDDNPLCSYPNDPAVTSEDCSECNEAIYNLPSTDPDYNPDCREFYNRDGEKSWHLFSRTLTCTADCHPYRRTENNIDPSLTDAGDCTAAGSGYSGATDGQFHWDAGLGVCHYCKNSGVWDSEHGACLYNAVPGQGQTCSAAQAGCREYTGNRGNNSRIILNSDFEGSTQGWAGIGGASVDLSNTTLLVGGNSLSVSGAAWSAGATLGDIINRNSSYTISFIAKAQSVPVNLSVRIEGAAGGSDFGEVGLVVSDWGIYRLNLPQLDYEAGDNDSLVINGNGNFYIDDIRLAEITDRYYLIKDSWDTPDSCYRDISGNPVGALYNLGCDEYNDRDNNIHYLHSFSQLCLESAVGCELMVDTHNYSGYNSRTFNEGDDSEITVPADNYIYVVYDEDKECASEDKGCQFLGESHYYEGDVLFSGGYLENDPDKYESILCAQSEVGCEEWAASEGAFYFKDPEDRECEWRQAGGGWGWYKKNINRCDDDGSGSINAGAETDVCFSDNDCRFGAACILDENEYSCPADWLKTFGLGGSGNRVLQPTNDGNEFWAGLCPAAQAGCAEYVDPISKFSKNEIFNADFSQDVDNNSIADGWDSAANGNQNIKLKPNTLYILAVQGANTAAINTINGSGAPISRIIEFSPQGNRLLGLADSLSVSSAAGGRASVLFYTYYDLQNVKAEIIAANAGDSTSGNNSRIELKEAVVDYQLKQALDRESCNGIVNFEEGCALFNERTQEGLNKKGLIWDADLTYNDGTGISPQAGLTSGDNDSNVLLKVSPDRVCDEWLACRSIVAAKDEEGREKNVCFDIGLCDSVDDNGDCDNFIVEDVDSGGDLIEQDAFLPGDFSQYSNATGYSKVGYSLVTDNSMKADYPLGSMEQHGEYVYLPNGGFEFAEANGYPIGWTWDAGGDSTWNANFFSVVDNPYQAQSEGIGYAIEGRNFLKLGSEFMAKSEMIPVAGGGEYILTAYINTINLWEGSAKIRVSQFDVDGDRIFTTDEESEIISFSNGNSWTFQLGKFTARGNASRIQITLYSDSETVGNFYFDDIKIRPGLNSREDDIGNKWYTPQTCRLYPEDDSLSCRYFDDSGIIRKGWWGYCLEYDRYPGLNDVCLLWWPVDKVKGDGIEEGAGYSDRYPVYYCTDYVGGVTYGSFGCGTGNCPQDLAESNYECTCNPLFANGGRVLLGPGNEIYVGGEGDEYTIYVAVESGGPWIEVAQSNNNTINVDVTEEDIGAPYFESVRVTCPSNSDCDMVGFSVSNRYDPPYCSEIVQTVTAAGQNKFWSGRAYEGSDYSYSCNTGLNLAYTDTCSYTADYYPFGSAYPPAGNTPYEWDSRSETGVQPLYYYEEYEDAMPTTQPRMGQYHDVEYIKRIFAQSYGTWAWDPSTCSNSPSIYCTDNEQCSGTCESYCVGVPPSASPGTEIVGGACNAANGTDDCISYRGNQGRANCDISTDTCDSGCNMGAACFGDDENCRNGYCSAGLCSGGPNDGIACFTDDDCLLADCFACNNGTQRCSHDPGLSCLSDAECVDTCSGGGIGRYGPIQGSEWSPPDNVCEGDDGQRPIYDTETGLCDPDGDGPDLAGNCYACNGPTCDFCSVIPEINNIRINNAETGNVAFAENQFAELSFNSLVDSQQLPMVMYAVGWGDNEGTFVSGVEMRDMPNEDNPHVLYHLYNYWDLRAKNSINQLPDEENSVYCGEAGDLAATNYSGAVINIETAPNSNYCAVKPRVMIKDNWGWCNAGSETYGAAPEDPEGLDDCNQWVEFAGWIVVTER